MKAVAFIIFAGLQEASAYSKIESTSFDIQERPDTIKERILEMRRKLQDDAQPAEGGGDPGPAPPSVDPPADDDKPVEENTPDPPKEEDPPATLNIPNDTPGVTSGLTEGQSSLLNKGLQELQDFQRKGHFYIVIGSFCGILMTLALTIISYYYGCDRVLKQIFYLIMCRKCLKFIVKVRRGKNFDKVIEDEIERNFGHQELFDDLDNNKQIKEITLFEMLEKEEKPVELKIENINKILYDKCFLDDQYQNDEEKEEYEESIDQMVQTIKILHDQKVSTPWVNYKKDFSLAFGPKENLLKDQINLVEISEANKDDGNFKNSTISRNDFYLYGLYNRIIDISEKDVDWEGLIRVQCKENHTGAIRIDDFDSIQENPNDQNDNQEDADQSQEMIMIHKFIQKKKSGINRKKTNLAANVKK